MSLEEQLTAAISSPLEQMRLIAQAIDTLAVSGGQGVAVANLGVTVDLVGVDGTGSNAAPLVETEARLDAIEAKLDALLTSLRDSGQIAP